MAKSLGKIQWNRNAEKLIQLAEGFTPVEYRRRSCQGEQFGFLTDFEKKIYLALPSGILKNSQQKKADIERRKSKLERDYRLEQQHTLESQQAQLEKQYLRRQAKKRLDDCIHSKPTKKITSKDEGYFKEFNLRLPIREQEWRQSMDMKLIKARVTAFGFKVSRCAQNRGNAKSKSKITSKRGSEVRPLEL